MGGSVAAVISRHARTVPGSLAVIDDAARLTFGELDRRASSMAYALRSRIAGSRRIVAICAPSSWQFVVAVLATWKAGAAYLPIDTGTPRSRTEAILTDAHPGLALRPEAGGSLGVTGVPEASIEQLLQEGEAGGSAEMPGSAAELNLSQAAAVIYTSGSSGTPKGVAITHANLANLARAAGHEMRLDSRDVFLQVAQPAFSAALEELFPVLAAGGAAAIPRDRARLASVSGMLAELRETEATVVELITPFYRVMGEELERAALALPASLRLVVVGGERSTLGDARRWLGLGADIVHVYGPTETTATATYYRVGPEARTGAASDPLPIGTAILDTRVHVLGPRLEPVRQGETGEIYVAGASVAHGYLGRAALTAERFVADPCSAGPGARMYRTGDLGLVRADGRMEFSGRSDSQFKIRGYRVEPAEIERTIEKHAAVSQAVVVPVDGVNGSRGILAYVMARSAVTEQDIISFTAEHLPDYMVPRQVMVAADLPLTAHGKIDRAAVAGGAQARPASGPGIRADVAEFLTGLWEDVLGTRPVAVDRSFISLGGDSLAAMRVLARISSRFGLELHPREVLESPGLAVLADAIAASVTPGIAGPAGSDRRAEGGPAARPEIAQPEITPADHVLAPAQECIWLLGDMTEIPELYCESFTCRIAGSLDAGILSLSLSELVNRHAILRASIENTAGSARWRTAGPERLPVQVLDLSGTDEHEAAAHLAKLVRAEASRPVRLNSGCLVRPLLYRLNEATHVLQLTVSHIAFDGRSLGIFLEELAELYAAHVAGRMTDLPRLAASYLDYARQEHERTASQDRAGNLAYWTRALDGAPGILDVSPGRRRPVTRSYRGGTIEFRIADALREEISQVARACAATPFAVVLTAWAVLLSRYSGQPDLVIGVPVEGRTDPAYARLVGLFVNTIILRFQLGCSESYAERVAATMGTLLEGMAHQSVPLDQVIAALRPDRSPACHPVFQVLFAFQAEYPELSAGGVTFSPPSNVPSGTAKFDLSLTLTDDGRGIRGSSSTAATCLMPASRRAWRETTSPC